MKTQFDCNCNCFDVQGKQLSFFPRSTIFLNRSIKWIWLLWQLIVFQLLFPFHMYLIPGRVRNVSSLVVTLMIYIFRWSIWVWIDSFVSSWNVDFVDVPKELKKYGQWDFQKSVWKLWEEFSLRFWQNKTSECCTFIHNSINKVSLRATKSFSAKWISWECVQLKYF